MDHTRVHRLLRMLWLINSRPGWDAPSLAREFGVDVRTIYRDVRGLSSVGLPCEYDRARRGYRSRDGVFLPPVQLTVEEALSLAVLCEQIAGQGAIPYLTAATRAIDKLRCVLPVETREEVGAMLEGVRVRTAAAADPTEARDVYDRLAEAVRAAAVVRCRYDSLSSSSEFDFHPYALFFCVRAWYAVGKHTGRGEIRTLKLNRFASVAPTGERFTRPEGFDLAAHLGNAWRMMRGPDHKVEVWFDAEFAPTVSDTIWHPTQQISHHEDGSMTFRCTVSGLDEIVWWVLSMGPHAVVRRPGELAERVKKLARGILGVYAGPRVSSPGARKKPRPSGRGRGDGRGRKKG